MNFEEAINYLKGDEDFKDFHLRYFELKDGKVFHSGLFSKVGIPVDDFTQQVKIFSDLVFENNCLVHENSKRKFYLLDPSIVKDNKLNFSIDFEGVRYRINYDMKLVHILSSYKFFYKYFFEEDGVIHRPLLEFDSRAYSNFYELKSNAEYVFLTNYKTRLKFLEKKEFSPPPFVATLEEYFEIEIKRKKLFEGEVVELGFYNKAIEYFNDYLKINNKELAFVALYKCLEWLSSKFHRQKISAEIKQYIDEDEQEKVIDMCLKRHAGDRDILRSYFKSLKKRNKVFGHLTKAENCIKEIIDEKINLADYIANTRNDIVHGKSGNFTNKIIPKDLLIVVSFHISRAIMEIIEGNISINPEYSSDKI